MTSFPFDIVGFDLDGTLLDTHGDLAAAVNHALSLEGRPAIPPAEVRDLIGGGAKVMLARALEVTGGAISEDRFAELHAALLEYYESHLTVETRLFSGGEQMLDDLAARGVKLAVVTNKLERLAVRILDELGLFDRFYTIIGGDTLGPGRAKPHPDMLFEMLDRAGVSREGARAAFVGDTTYDTGAAAAAGLPCVAVSFGFCDCPPREMGAHAVIDHFDQLLPALENMGVALVR
jgi:phosphoglycolate phosphatase